MLRLNHIKKHYQHFNLIVVLLIIEFDRPGECSRE